MVRGLVHAEFLLVLRLNSVQSANYGDATILSNLDIETMALDAFESAVDQGSFLKT